MKIFSVVTLMTQLVLICWSKYYGHVANAEIMKLEVAPESSMLEVLSKFQHYNDWDDYLSYLAIVIWIISIVVLYKNNASSTKLAQLCILLPILVSFVLSLI